jgi:hypothetical protein
MIYAMEPSDEFSILNHPWEPTLQLIHLLVAPLFVFGMGLAWKKHVWGKVVQGEKPRRRTGLFLAALAAPAALSGWFLQVSVEEVWRQFWSIFHLSVGLAWGIMYFVHQVASAKKTP